MLKALKTWKTICNQFLNYKITFVNSLHAYINGKNYLVLKNGLLVGFKISDIDLDSDLLKLIIPQPPHNMRFFLLWIDIIWIYQTKFDSKIHILDAIGSASYVVLDTDYDNFGLLCTCQV